MYLQLDFSSDRDLLTRQILWTERKVVLFTPTRCICVSSSGQCDVQCLNVRILYSVGSQALTLRLLITREVNLEPLDQYVKPLSYFISFENSSLYVLKSSRF